MLCRLFNEIVVRRTPRYDFYNFAALNGKNTLRSCVLQSLLKFLELASLDGSVRLVEYIVSCDHQLVALVVAFERLNDTQRVLLEQNLVERAALHYSPCKVRSQYFACRSRSRLDDSKECN